MSGIDPRKVPVHHADRGHAQVRNLLDQLIADHKAAGSPDAVSSWVELIGTVITRVVESEGGVRHYESILAGVAALAVQRLAATGGDG